MSAVWDIDLPPTQKLVLMALSDHSNDQGMCFPGMDGIAEKCNISRSTVIRCIKKLEENGLISVKRRKNPKTKKQYVNQYTMLFVPDVNLTPRPECQMEQKPGVTGDTVIITKKLKEPSLTNLSVFPANLNVDLWFEYLDYRKDRGEKKYTKKGEQMKTKWLAEQGDHETQQNIVNLSIMNNWAGLFALKPRGTTNEKNRPLSAPERVREANRQREEERQRLGYDPF